MSRTTTNVIDGVFVGALLGVIGAIVQLWRPGIFLPPSATGSYLVIAALAAAICGGLVGLFVQIREAYFGGAVTALIWILFLNFIQVGTYGVFGVDADFAALVSRMLMGMVGATLLGVVANLLYTWSAQRLRP